MAPTKNPKITRRQTGTVPKIISTSSSSTSSQSQFTITAPRPSSTIKTPLSSVSASSQKNTEVVAPTRRDLNDLNDYLLSVAESTKHPPNGVEYHQPPQQLDPASFELDNLNLHETQRYCWPVRPLPRRNSPNKDFNGIVNDNQPQSQQSTAATTNHHHHQHHLHHHQHHAHPISYSTTSNSSALGSSSQAIGVVIPTTPNATAAATSDAGSYAISGRSQNPISPFVSNSQQHSHIVENSNGDNSNISQALANFDSELTWEQRLNFIQYFLSLTSKALNKDQKVSISDIDCSSFDEKMVNEMQPHLYINSASLEEVDHREANDTRAHSVTSIHSATAPDTPTAEELQARLEASNRNIQNIKEQQQQLLHIQQLAKDHLVQMENIRNQQNQLSFAGQNGSAPPNYESVGHVQNDMSNLVNRMKNITTFIHGQNELSALLGEDGPEIIAEQEALQRKLQELQQQKEGMRNLVSELQEVNLNAENSLKQRRQQENNEIPRVVPIEYQRVVPIELVGSSRSQNDPPHISNGHDQIANGHCNGSADHDQPESPESNRSEAEAQVAAETSDMIRQKMADIATMKNQLKRLKNMMDTVQLIEDKNDGKSIADIAAEAESLLASSTLPIRRESDSAKLQQPPLPRSSVPPRAAAESDDVTEEEAEVTDKVRLLHEMTQDLRAQAANLSSERDRLRSLRDEMIRRKEADEILAYDNSRSESAQMTRQADQPDLKADYEVKKKEFEKLCERLESEEDIVESQRQTAAAAAAAAHNEEMKQTANSAAYYQENWRRQNTVSSNSSLRGGDAKPPTIPATVSRGKDSADSGAADVHGIASFEAGSIQSGSSRSFSMPPPMRTLSTRDTSWRKNSQDNSQSQFEVYAPMPPPLPVWNPNYYYPQPFAQHCNIHGHHHAMNANAGTEFYCCHQNAFGHAATATTASTQQPQPTNQQSTVTSNDPVLLQQFIQTQQMLINSVCQCNQLLWHQQREINNLNNAVMLLQERLANADVSLASSKINRAESVPPTGATVSNNIYTTHRAQSEQPFQPIQQPLLSPARHPYGYNYSSNFQQQQQQRRTLNSHAHHQHSTSYNYSASEQQATGICSQLPPVPPHNHHIDYNSVPQSPQTTSYNHLNNDVHQHSANMASGPPATIYMHHHNNTMPQTAADQTQPPIPHTNNHHSNLLTSQQNCLNSPPNVPQSTITNNSVGGVAPPPVGPNTPNNAAASTLNNQVPPGNRANNYWDNFRSYSRQNLLSNTSCKSNEEQQQHQQHHMTAASPFGVNIISNANINGFRNANAMSTGNLVSYSNNLTPPSFDSKYVYTFRNPINSNLAVQHQLQNAVPSSSASLMQQSLPTASSLQAGMENYALNSGSQQQPQQQQHPTHNAALLINQATQSDNLNVNSNEMFIYNNPNINSSHSSNNSVTAIFGSSDFRNMNFSFGANEMRKKIPIKTSCSTKRIRHSQSMTNDMTQMFRSLPGFEDHRGLNESGNSSSAISRNICLEFENPQQLLRNERSHHDDDNANAGNSNASGYSEGSEENKKNLLVNALRNDKFTSKFFERLKEDIYREVYSILHATESQPQFLEQLYRELQLVPTSDPIRNIVIQAMHDIYKRSFGVVSESNEATLNNFSQSNHEPISPSENLNEAASSHPESNHENELMNILLNSTEELRRLAYKIMFDGGERSFASPVEKVGIKSNLSSSSASSSPKPPMEIYRPDYDLVNHIMTIIRSTIQSQRIDDEVMIQIAKLTIASLERLSSTLGHNALQIDRLLISPKELYRKMKNFDRRDRDRFLEQYEAYLQSMFVMKIVNDEANTNNVNLATRRATALATANILSNSLSDASNFRRPPTLTPKSNIAIGGGGFGLELNCNRKSDHHAESMGHGGEASNINPPASKSKTVQDDAKLQKNRTRTRRTKSNASSSTTPTSTVTHFFAANNDVSNDTLSSPTINSNSITNEDLAEADQVCSSTSAPLAVEPQRFSSNSEANQDDNVRTATVAADSTEDDEMDGNRNIEWPKDRRSRQQIASQDEAEAEAETFDTYTTTYENHHDEVVASSSGVIEEVASSSTSGNVTGLAQPIMNDAACAVIYQRNSNTPDSNSGGNIRSNNNNNSSGNGNSSSEAKPKNTIP